MRPDVEAYRRRAAEVLDRAYQAGLERRKAIQSSTANYALDLAVTAAEKGRYRIVNSEALVGLAERVESGDSSLVYFGPHFGGLPPDSETVGETTQEFVPLERTGIYTAERHLDPNRIDGRIAGTLHRAEVAITLQARKTRKFTTFPVIHTPEDIAYYGEHRKAIGGITPRRFNIEAVRNGADFLLAGNAITGGNALIVAPGGSRDSQAKLTKAHVGLEYTLKEARVNTFALAIALIPNARKNVPLFGKIDVVIGQPLSWEDVNDKYIEMQKEAIGRGTNLGMTRSDLMMTYLASLLPEKHQGYYKPILLRYPELADPEHWK